MSLIAFYRGIAAWQAEDMKAAVASFAQARKLGYKEKEAFDYAISCYAGLQDNEGIVAIAKEALPLFGDKDPQYMNVIINDNVNKGNLDEALSMVDAAIANKPTAALYNLKGFVLEQKKDEDSALEFYKRLLRWNRKTSRLSSTPPYVHEAGCGSCNRGGETSGFGFH